MIHIVNKNKHTITKNDVYIGRGSPLGNPFSGSKELSRTRAQFQCESREEAIASYEEYLLTKIVEKDKAICDELNKIWLMSKVGYVNLLCFCNPKPCHGDIIKKIVEKKL